MLRGDRSQREKGREHYPPEKRGRQGAGEDRRGVTLHNPGGVRVKTQTVCVFNGQLWRTSPVPKARQTD